MFFYTSFKNQKQLEEMFDELIVTIDTRIAESVMYVNKIKPAEITDDILEELAEETSESQE